MPIVRIELSAGRSVSQKQQVAKAVTDAMVQFCNCDPTRVSVIFSDVQASDWAVGGRLLSDPEGYA